MMTRIKHILIGRNPLRTLIRASLLALLSLILFGVIARPVRIRGISMEPTLTDGTIHFVNFVKFRCSEPQRGDLVAIAMPGGRAYYLKRILGLPGETIGFDHGQLFINDEACAEPYISMPGDWQLPAFSIPDGQYFVAGDNRRTEFTAHTLGLVERARVKGVLLK